MNDVHDVAFTAGLLFFGCGAILGEEGGDDGAGFVNGADFEEAGGVSGEGEEVRLWELRD